MTGSGSVGSVRTTVGEGVVGGRVKALAKSS